MKKENVLVSACLLGIHCRYDGKCQEIESFQKILPDIMEKYNLIPFCPEIYGGLSTPRNPVEIKERRVYTKAGVDVTEAFYRGAQEALYMTELYNSGKAILKQRSPSCGSGKIYDGTFSNTIIDGDGITAELLKQHGILVVDEINIVDIM